MKKISYMLVSALVTGALAPLMTISAPDIKPNTCPSKPYPVSNIVTRSLQGLFGLNFFAGKGVDTAISHQIKKSVDKVDNLKIKIRPYSAFDLMAGKFKGMEVSTDNIVAEGISLTLFEAKSLCDFTYLDYKADPIVPKTPVYLSFKGTISEDDINSVFQSRQYQDNMKDLKVKVGPFDFKLISFLDPKVDIKGKDIFMSANIQLNGFLNFVKIPVYLKTQLAAKNDKLVFNNMQIPPEAVPKELKTLVESIRQKELVVFNLNDLQKNNIDVTVKKIKTNNDKIDIEGTVWIPADASF